MKKKKSLFIALTLICISLITTSVNAASWSGRTTAGSNVSGIKNITGATLNINFGEVDGENNLITRLSIPLSQNEQDTGKIIAGCTANHYSMSLDNADSNGIITGLDTSSPRNGGEKLKVNALKTGTQTIHIITTNTGDDWPAGINAYDNTVTVVSSYSTKFESAATALDITFNDNKTVYNAENVNIFPENIDKFEAIINDKANYEALNSYEKQRLDSIIAAASNGTYANYTALYNAADAYLTSLARIFITSTDVQGLQGKYIPNKNNYATIIDAETEYNGLKDIVKDRVNLLLTNATTAEYSGYATDNYPTLLKKANAYKFIDTYVLDTADINLTKEIDERILESRINEDYKWQDLAGDVQSFMNEFLYNTIGRDYEDQIYYVRNHYEQILADEFVDNEFFKEYEDVAGTDSLRNYDIIDEMNEEATDKFEDLANKIVGDVVDEYATVLANKYISTNEGYVNELKAKIDDEIENTDFETIVETAQDYLDDLEEARAFVEEHKLNDELTAEIAEDIITLGDAIDNARVKAMVEEIIDKTMEDKIDEADDFLTALALDFIDRHYLDKLINNEIAAEVITGQAMGNAEEDELTKEMAQDIVKDSTAEEFEGLTDTVKSRVLEATLEAEGFEDIVAAAQAFLDDTEAEEFIADNELDKDFTKAIATNIVNNLEKKFDELSSERVQGLVEEKLGASIEDIIAAAQDYLDITAAEEFYKNYLKDLDPEKIADGEDAWKDSSEKVQELINELLRENEVDSTYPELLEKAKEELIKKAAEDFINEYLTDEDGEVIGEVDSSNYKKVLEAADPYDALPEEAKTLVNDKLKDAVDTTYPELLEAAQEIEKSPKTGDYASIMVAILVVSIIGLGIAIKKRK